MLLLLFLKGVAVGIVIAVPVGPVGVLCVRRAVFDGKLFGFVSGLGAAVADTAFGIIAAFGLTVVSDWLTGHEGALRAIGGLFLLYVGIKALRNREFGGEKAEKSAENLLRAFLSTFLLTITNPVTIVAFLGVFAAVGFSGREATLGHGLILVAGVLVGSLFWWAGISLIAGSYRRSFTSRHFLWINRISGTLLTVSGVALLLSVVVALVA